MNFSLLELNLNSNFAQMAIVLWHIFHSSQASPFIKLPKCKHFYMLNYVGLHWAKVFYCLQTSAPKYTICSSQRLSTQPVPQQVALVKKPLNQHHPAPEYSSLIKTRPFKILQSGKRQFTILCWLTSNPYPSTLQLSAHHRQRNFLSLSRLCLQEGLELYMSKLLYSIEILCKTS